MEMVADGNRQGIGGIEKLRVQIFAEQMSYHLRYLIFGGIAIAGYRLLDAPGCILHNGDIARKGGCHHHALRPAQLKHSLHVFAKKRVFDGHLVGVVVVHEPQNGFVEFLELQLVGAIFAQLNHAILNHADDARLYRNDAVARHHRAGVDTQDNFLFGNGSGIRGNNHRHGQASLQSNGFSAVLTRKPGKKIIFWGKIAVISGLVAYIAYVLYQQPFEWATVRRQLRSVDHPEAWSAGLALLTPINWGLEALKWQILLRRVEQTSWADAFRGVLAGLSLGFALPAQLGDTAGRVLSLRTRQRGAAIGASLVSGGMQFYVALVFGTVAWAHHLGAFSERNTSAGQVLLLVLVLLSAGGIAFGLVRQRLIGWLATRPALVRFATYWNVAGLYTNSELGRALTVAALRYLIFSVQFYVAMRLVGIGLTPDVAASGIGLVFLVKTVTPAFNFLSDLGVREAAALWVLRPSVFRCRCCLRQPLCFGSPIY